VVDASLSVVKTSCQWRQLPTDFLSSLSVHQQFGVWRDDGTWRSSGQNIARAAAQSAGDQEAKAAHRTDTRMPTLSLLIGDPSIGVNENPSYNKRVSLKRTNASPNASQPNSMLLVLPVPFRSIGGALFFEEQACNGLNRWADNFAHVTLAAPIIPESLAENIGFSWKPMCDLETRDQLTLIPLPWAYGLGQFARNYGRVRQRLRAAIAQNRHLQFGIGGLVGDWASIACLEAIAQRRRFAIHTDRVEHEVLLEVSKEYNLPKRMKAKVVAALVKPYHRYLIRRCALGLWHGSDCYHAYSPYCQESHIIHDVHTRPEDCIDNEALEAKVGNVDAVESISVCYAGRLDPMKAPLDWLKAIAMARDLGANMKAIWFGEGTLRHQAEAEIKRLRLEETVLLPGFLSSRPKLLEALRSSQLMVCTHVTPESPRCLLEALISGTPIVGYESKYSSDLTKELGGGSFVPMHDWEALGRRIADLIANRTKLKYLIREAALNGKRFNDKAVFAERSDLIKQFS
jgi:glycosyltransferase involved in cell wall biosynthesis